MSPWKPHIDPGQRPRFLAITEALARDVGEGSLRPGDRLPTHRDLARDLHLAVATVSRAYAEAERRGLIEGTVGRGTFVAGSPASYDSFLAEREPDPGLVDLSLDMPLYEAAPDLAAAFRQLATRRDLQNLLRYHPSRGLVRHRLAGARWAERFGLQPTADQVLVCAGAQHAVTTVLSTLASPGDVIYTEELTYPGIRGVAEHLHLRLVGLPMDRDGLLPDAFEAAVLQHRGKALYTIPTIQNPTTALLPLARRQELARIAEKHHVAILEDDVQRLLADSAPPPIARFAPQHGYFIASMSKAVAGGLRIAFLVAPDGAVEALSRRIWATNWMVSPITAELAATWIEDGTADRVVRRKRRQSASRHAVARLELGRFPYSARSFGYSLWMPLPPAWEAAQFVHEARCRGVAVMPAQTFMVGAGPAPAAIRISLGAAESTERLRHGLRTLAAVLASRPRARACVL